MKCISCVLFTRHQSNFNTIFAQRKFLSRNITENQSFLKFVFDQVCQLILLSYAQRSAGTLAAFETRELVKCLEGAEAVSNKSITFRFSR